MGESPEIRQKARAADSEDGASTSLPIRSNACHIRASRRVALTNNRIRLLR
jgi:hypothetical protein